MRQFRFLVTMIAVLALVFVSCKKEELQNLPANRINGVNLKCATESELNAFNDCNDVIHYKVARYYAYWEIENSLSEPLGVTEGNYIISTYPTIIYDYDSKPKYYEFDIIENGDIVATIATIAKKESDNIIAFMFDYPLLHDNSNGLSYFVGYYPTVFYGTPAAPGSSPSLLLDESGTNVLTQIPSTNELTNVSTYINYLDAESQAMHSSTITELQAEINDKQQEVDAFWQEADSLTPAILTMTDAEIIADVQGSLQKAGGPSWDIYMIPAYNNANLQHTRWTRWCGPSAVCWAYRGLYSHYPINNPNNYLRIRGDGDFNYFKDDIYASYRYNRDSIQQQSLLTDFGLYYTLLQQCSYLGSQRPMYPAGMNRGMKQVTSNNYKVVSCTAGAGHTNIRNNNLPIFIVLIYDCNGHYVVGFASGYEKKKKNGSIKNKHYLVTDNGTAISDHQYAPYWRSQEVGCTLKYKMSVNN